MIITSTFISSRERELIKYYFNFRQTNNLQNNYQEVNVKQLIDLKWASSGNSWLVDREIKPDDNIWPVILHIGFKSETCYTE